VHGPEDVANDLFPDARSAYGALPRTSPQQCRRIIREYLISQGSVNASIVHPARSSMRVTEHASAIILLHNHPSGVRHPSAEIAL